MVMVVHQTIIMDIYFVTLTSFTEYLQELLLILITSVNIGTRYTSVDDMVKAVKGYSGFSCHILTPVMEVSIAHFSLVVVGRHLTLRLRFGRWRRSTRFTTTRRTQQGYLRYLKK
jgi:hypothetical protein